jgi:hypothetical protein
VVCFELWMRKPRFMKKNSFLIDKITRSIEDAITGKSYETDVCRFESVDLKYILKKTGWQFNWQMEFSYPDRELYKLVIENDIVIQGLISLQRAENYIEMHLIKNAPHNFGRSKQYLGAAGNLVAFACKTSFEAGFEGFVAFRAKTKLIQHYIDTLGAELIYRDRMKISGKAAEKIVNSYYKNWGIGR